MLWTSCAIPINTTITVTINSTVEFELLAALSSLTIGVDDDEGEGTVTADALAAHVLLDAVQ